MLYYIAMQNKILFQKLLPLLLLFTVVIIDQATKFLVAKYIPLGTVAFSFFGDFFRLVHTRNIAVAFSLGSNLPDTLRHIAFAFVPLLVLILIMCVYFRNNTFTPFMRWLLCGIVGGGLGNLIDRFTRPLGVVDFLDFKFYGILGFERWPTFNVADAVIVVCIVLFILYYIAQNIKMAQNTQNTNLSKSKKGAKV